MANYTVKRNDETLSYIVYTYYGSEFSYLEEVLQANPFLSEEDIFLTKGLTVYLPDLPNNQTQDRISLWS